MEGRTHCTIKLQRIKLAAGGVCLFFSRSVINQGDFRAGVGEGRDRGDGKGGGVTLFRVAVLPALDSKLHCVGR